MLAVRSADPEGGVVLAEAVKFDTGDLVLLFLALLAWAVGGAIALGGIGLGIGIGISRLRQSKREVAGLERGNLLSLWAVAGVLAFVSMWVAVAYSPRELGGASSVLALPAPAVWGWWMARTHRYAGPPAPPPPWPDPPTVDPPVPPVDPGP